MTGCGISNQFLMHGLITALMMKATSTSEMSVNYNHTAQRNNPEDNGLNKELQKTPKKQIF
jgi:hypothetical protein